MSFPCTTCGKRPMSLTRDTCGICFAIEEAAEEAECPLLNLRSVLRSGMAEIPTDTTDFTDIAEAGLLLEKALTRSIHDEQTVAGYLEASTLEGVEHV